MLVGPCLWLACMCGWPAAFWVFGVTRRWFLILSLGVVVCDCFGGRQALGQGWGVGWGCALSSIWVPGGPLVVLGVCCPSCQHQMICGRITVGTPSVVLCSSALWQRWWLSFGLLGVSLNGLSSSGSLLPGSVWWGCSIPVCTWCTMCQITHTSRAVTHAQ